MMGISIFGINILAPNIRIDKLLLEKYADLYRGIRDRKDSDLLLLSGRHFPEAILWTLADYTKRLGKSVAVINPVGHYSDGQTRVIGPYKYFRKIKNLIILSSTQSKLGGSVSVLANVIKLIRNCDLAKRIEKVEVII